MSFWENTAIGKYFGTQKQTQMVGDSIVKMEADAFSLDAFSIGSGGNSYYLESTDFVLLQEKNFVLNNVIGKIAKKFSHASFTDDKETPLLKKINNPNKFQSKEEFLKEFAVFILSAGFSVIWKRYVSFGNFETLELINVNPSRVAFNNEKITFEFENQSHTALLTDVIICYDTVRNHLNKKGYSRITPLRSQLENISLAQKAKNIQISNSGTTIVSPKQVAAGSNIDEGLNAPVPIMGGGLVSQKQKLEEKLNSRGLDNRIIVSSKGLDAVNLSEKLSKIDFHKIIETDLLSVCDAYSFPIELTPYGAQAKFDNKAVAELSVLENEVVPLANNLQHSLNSEFPKQGSLKVNYDNLEAMSIVKGRIQTTNGKTIDQYKILFDIGVITAAEFKKVLIDNQILNGK